MISAGSARGRGRRYGGGRRQLAPGLPGTARAARRLRQLRRLRRRRGHQRLRAVHRDLTKGMAACPADLAQVSDGPPLALFADGLDTAIYGLDPALAPVPVPPARDGLADSAHRQSAPARWSRHGEHLPRAGERPCRTARRAAHCGSATPSLHLRAISWGTQERLCYRAPDGLDLDGLLILPPRQKPRRMARSR